MSEHNNMNDDDKGGINWLRDRLYSRNSVPKARARRKLRPDLRQVTESWDDIDAQENQPPVPSAPKPIVPEEKKTGSVLTMVLIASFAFFVVSAGISIYLFAMGSNVVSANNIDIEINGPVAIAGGEELALQIGVVNRNGVPLELTDLIIDYPDGTRSALSPEIEMPRHRESFGTIKSGERKKSTIRSILFGKEDSEHTIMVTLEYRIDGSNAILYKEKPYNVLLSSAPIALNVDSVKEITSGQEVEFKIRAVSNSTGILKDVLVISEYPFGFQFTGSDPEPLAGETVWNIGDMSPGDVRELTVRGILNGQDTEQRIFRFETGVRDESSPTEIAAAFNKAEIPITIQRPFIKLALGINGDNGRGERVVRRGETIRGNITWANTLGTSIHDGRIEITFDGVAVDRKSVEAQKGFYRSSDNTIIWSSETDTTFEKIEPGDKGSVGFNFATVPVSPDVRIVNPTITVAASVQGRRISEDEVPEAIESSVDREIKIASDIILASRATYSGGPFENSGPIPPKAETDTTYAIVWTVANTSNDMQNVQVTGTLPQYVEWFNLVEPSSEDVRYNPVNRQITWRIGDVSEGVGYRTSARELAFKVVFKPSLGQVGEAPALITNQSIAGLDIFTDLVIQTGHRDITTSVRNDPGLGQGNFGTVVE